VAISLFNYFRQSRDELKKVSWPTWPEPRNNTLLVIGISLFVALFLGLLDIGFNYIIQKVIIKQ